VPGYIVSVAPGEVARLHVRAGDVGSAADPHAELRLMVLEACRRIRWHESSAAGLCQGLEWEIVVHIDGHATCQLEAVALSLREALATERASLRFVENVSRS
jgi:hypothetical protein